MSDILITFSYTHSMNETVDHSNQAESKKPESKSFTEIDAQFEGFRERWAQRLATQPKTDIRGGVPYPDRRTVLQNEGNRPDYHQEASFDRSESQYVIRAVTLLTKMADGEEGFHLAQKIVKHFEQGEQKLLLPAMEAAIYELLQEFAEQYPNMLPALDAMYEVAGAEGTKLSLRACYSTLQRRVLEMRNSEEAETFKRPGLPMREFVVEHPTESENYSYEVVCSGMAFGKKIAVQAEIASEPLAMYIIENNIPYDITAGDPKKTDMSWKVDDEAMKHFVHELYEKEKAKQTQ